MSELDAKALLDSYLSAAAGLGVAAEARVHQDLREELVLRDGILESVNTVDFATVTLRVSAAGEIAFAAVPAHSDPAQAFAFALSGRFEPVHVSRIPRLPAGAFPGRSPECELSKLSFETANGTLLDRELLAELRIDQLSRTVSVANTFGGAQGYQTSTASVVLRLTGLGRAGRERAHIDWVGFGSDASPLLRRLPAIFAPCAAALRADDLPADQPLPAAVLFEGPVAARLLGLFARALCGDAVIQGRSALAGRLGTIVTSPEITIADDPCAQHAPWYAPFDDEGTPTARRVLVRHGTLLAYLGSRETGETLEAAMPGNAWQAAPSLPPRPGPGNLWIEPQAGDSRPEVPALKVIQAHGLNLANDITGDFSMGATALVERTTGEQSVVKVTVAGNVYDMFRRALPIGSEVSWFGGSASYCGAPGLLVAAGLSVGR